MTDVITPKAAWTRCNACQQRVENNRHEIDIHKINCPHRLQLQIQELTRRIKALEKDIESIDEQIAGDPAIDPDAIAPWPDDDDDDTEPDLADLRDITSPEDDLDARIATVSTLGTGIA